ncbi:MAG: hypothetical protein RL769_638 [Pseudomonadota bacterium]|jgi:tRNA (guanine-N7-)-methyltransferase
MNQESTNSTDKLIRSFGRIKSRKLSDPKKDLLENFLPKISLEQHFNDLKKLTKAHNVLEIGFGFGDFLFNSAYKNPHKNYFGFEPHLNGVVNLLDLVKKNNIKNIKLSTQDIRHQINEFPDNFFETIYILFPDPWPKSKHHKRRLITQKFLDETLSPKLKDLAKIIIATDHDDYKTWILAHILKSQKFLWTAQFKEDWQNLPKDWFTTKYQKKALLEKRIPIFLELIKK